MESTECANCDHVVKKDAVKYFLSDLDSEVLAWVEENLRNEVTENSILCGECFEGLTMKMWTETQEPEVLQSSSKAVEGPDPLSEVDVKIEESQDKEEQDVVDCEVPIEYEHGPIKELTNYEETYGQKSSQDANKNESDSDDDIEMLYQDPEDQNDSPDVPKDKSDDSWTPNESHRVETEPPVLDGLNLPSWMKCDSCNTFLTKKPYQKLPEGLEKIIITSERRRDKSPERVCCPCWKRVHSIAMNKIRNLKKRELTTSADTDNNEYIKIPGYERVPSTSSTCLVKGCNNKDKRLVPTYLRKVIFTDYNIFVKEHSRICQNHRKEFNIDWNFLKKQANNIDIFNAAEVEAMLDFLRDEALKLPE